MQSPVSAKKSSFGVEYQLLLPADLVVETFEGTVRTRTQRLSAEPYRATASSRGLKDGAVLRLSHYEFQPIIGRTRRDVTIGAETTLGMRHNWDGVGDREFEHIEAMLRAGKAAFVARHGWTRSGVTATLRNKKQALADWLVFTDLLEADGIIPILR